MYACVYTGTYLIVSSTLLSVSGLSIHFHDLIVQISVVDAGGVGDVIETFPVASDTITCIAAVPEFDEHDPEVLASKCKCCLALYVHWLCHS